MFINALSKAGGGLSSRSAEKIINSPEFAGQPKAGPRMTAKKKELAESIKHRAGFLRNATRDQLVRTTDTSEAEEVSPATFSGLEHYRRKSLEALGKGKTIPQLTEELAELNSIQLKSQSELWKTKLLREASEAFNKKVDGVRANTYFKDEKTLADLEHASIPDNAGERRAQGFRRKSSLDNLSYELRSHELQDKRVNEHLAQLYELNLDATKYLDAVNSHLNSKNLPV